MVEEQRSLTQEDSKKIVELAKKYFKFEALIRRQVILKMNDKGMGEVEATKQVMGGIRERFQVDKERLPNEIRGELSEWFEGELVRIEDLAKQGKLVSTKIKERIERGLTEEERDFVIRDEMINGEITGTSSDKKEVNPTQKNIEIQR